MLAEPAVLATLVVVVATGVLAGLLVATGRGRALPGLAVAGSLALIVAATVLPSPWTNAEGGQLALAPGRGGLGKAGLQLLAGSPGAAAQLLVLNGLLYLPLGAALAWGWPARPGLLVLPLVTSVTIEVVQHALLDRVAATDDVLVNVGGAVAGWVLLTWWQRHADAAGRASRPGPWRSRP